MHMHSTPTGSRPGIMILGAALLVAVPAHAAQLSRATYEELSEARELMDGGQTGESVAMLKKLLADVENRAYAKAITLQTLGYAYTEAGNDRAAIDAFERAVAIDDLPREPRLRIRNMLARLYARTEQYGKAKEQLDTWFAEIDSPAADDHALKASILVQLERYPEGIEAIRRAIEMAGEPNEPYHQTLVALLYNAERYAEAATALEEMVANWPGEKRYWSQLAGVYLNLERNEDAHAVLKLAYRRGMLEEESELVRLARVSLSIDVPAQAAELLQAEIERGRLANNEAHWELAGHAWARAREWGQAIDAYARAAQHGSAGKYHLRRARLYTYQNDWEGAIRAARSAIDSGSLDSPGEAYILIGRGHLERGDFEEGLAAFEQAQRFSNTADQAQQWSRYAARRSSQPGSAEASAS